MINTTDSALLVLVGYLGFIVPVMLINLTWRGLKLGAQL